MTTLDPDFRSIVLRHLGPPVDIEGIIRAMGLELNKKAELETEISGELERLPNDNFRISTNKSDHYFRQRFTMAHELGHYMLHGHLIGNGLDDTKAYRSGPSGRFYNLNIGPREETQANKFAARLLMPKSKIIEHAKVGISVGELAKLFQTSPRAMEIRLSSLGFSVNDDQIVSVPTT